LIDLVEPKYETCYAAPVVQETVAPPVVVSFEERDIIKDSESVEASDGDDQKSLFVFISFPHFFLNVPINKYRR
jgi:hypothetical protein